MTTQNKPLTELESQLLSALESSENERSSEFRQFQTLVEKQNETIKEQNRRIEDLERKWEEAVGVLNRQLKASSTISNSLESVLKQLKDRYLS